MERLLILPMVFLSILCGCTANPSESVADVKITVPEDVSPKKLTLAERVELRRLLDVYYSKDPKEWEKARMQILAMGEEGVEALAIFMIKFFAAGNISDRPEQDIGRYWESARRELVRLKEKAVPYLILAMSHPDMGKTRRLQCSMTLVEIGQPAVLPLVENLKNGCLDFRYMVLETLGTIGDKRAVSGIVSLYQSLPQPEGDDEDAEDPTFGLRFYCVKAIGQIGDKDGLPVITHALDDPNLTVRKQAVESSVRFNCPEALPMLEKALEASRTCAIGYESKIKRCMEKIAAARDRGR